MTADQFEDFKEKVLKLLKERNDNDLEKHGEINNKLDSIKKDIDPLLEERRASDRMMKKIDGGLTRWGKVIAIIAALIILVQQMYGVVANWIGTIIPK